MSHAMTQPGQRFWDGMARRYAAMPVRDEAAYARTLNRVRAHLARDASVLEIGCGTGSTALALARDVGRIVATDISGEMVRIAREKASAQGVANVSFAQGVVGEATAAGAPYDAVAAFNLLHLVEDVPALLGRVRMQLTPGGLLVSKTPCLSGSVLARVAVPALRLVGKAPYVNFLTVRALERMIAEAGFEIVETGSYPAKPPSRFVVARKI